ncbi:hypothetical protein [Spiroplasma endosymbiont of Amphibalanus improvisus]|uniref:hypothetical protein n=1 Tax=Spiroplasma endosymbiont of Amphibalanus improvisus TaxID=3066327 RepID=UPI00313DDCD3
MYLDFSIWAWIGIITSSILGFVLIIIILLNMFKYFKINGKSLPIQMPEIRKTDVYVDSKSNQHKLLTNKTELKKVKKIIIAVHDFFGCNLDFNPIINDEKKFLILAYNQRGYDKIEPNKHFSVYIQDLNEFISAVNKKYKNTEIELLLEGYSCGLINYVNKANKNLISKYHLLNPISNFKIMSLHTYIFFRKTIGFVIGYKKNINIQIDYRQLTDDKILLKYFNSKKIYRNILELSHIKKINKKLIHFQKNKNQKVLVYQSKNDPFYSEKKYKKLIVKLNAKEIVLSEDKHFITKNIFNIN